MLLSTVVSIVSSFETKKCTYINVNFLNVALHCCFHCEFLWNKKMYRYNCDFYKCCSLPHCCFHCEFFWNKKYRKDIIVTFINVALPPLLFPLWVVLKQKIHKRDNCDFYKCYSLTPLLVFSYQLLINQFVSLPPPPPRGVF